MSDETEFLDYFEVLARRLTPFVLVAYLKAVRDLVRAMNIDAIARLIEHGGLEAVADAIVSEQLTQAAFHTLQLGLRQVVDTSGAAFFKDIPAGPSQGVPIARVTFQSLNPNVVRAIEEYETEVIGGITNAMRTTVKEAVREGLKEGVNPRAIALELKEVLGLAPNQEIYVRNYRDELINLDPAALRRELTDGRLDRTIAKAIRDDTPLTREQIDKAVARYRANWAKWQAETVSRTVTLNAMREAQDLAWDQAIAAGKVTEDDIVDTWITTLDGRERATHHAMHGTQKGYRDVWFVPGVGAQRYPGEDEYNCRCRVWRSLRIRRASQSGPTSAPRSPRNAA